jgi:hypothetical protein
LALTKGSFVANLNKRGFIPVLRTNFRLQITYFSIIIVASVRIMISIGLNWFKVSLNKFNRRFDY